MFFSMSKVDLVQHYRKLHENSKILNSARCGNESLHSGGRGRRITLSSKPSWPTLKVPDQAEPYSETKTQNQK